LSFGIVGQRNISIGDRFGTFADDALLERRGERTVIGCSAATAWPALGRGIEMMINT